VDQGADPLTLLLNLGPVGAFLVLWLTGRVVSKSEYDRAERRAEEWKQQYTRESEAHDVTRQAATRDRERSDAGVEASRTAVTLLSALGHLPLPPVGGS